MARRIVIFITAVFAVVGIAVTAAMFWVTSESGSRHISEKLRSGILDKTGLEITFSQIELDIFPPRIRVQGITGKDSKGEISCTVDEAELTPSWLDLVSGVLTVEEVYLGAPGCDIHLTPASLDKLVFAKKKQSRPFEMKPSKLPDFEVFAVSEAGLTVSIDDPGRLGAIRFEVTDLGLDVTRDSHGIEIRGLLARAKGRWADGDKQAAEEIRNLEFRAGLTDGGAEVRHLTAQVAGGKLGLRDAHIPIPLWPGGPRVADVSLEMPLDVLNRLPLGFPEIEGHAAYYGRVSVRRDSDGKIGLDAKGRVQLDGITAGEFVLGDLEGLVALSPEKIEFAEATLKAADGELTGSGSVAFDEALTSAFDLHLNDIELAHLLEQVTLKGTYVTQRMTGPVKLKGQLNPFRLSGNIRIDVRDHTVLTGPFRDKTSGVALHAGKVLAKGNVIITDKYFEGKNLETILEDTKVGVHMKVEYDTLDWFLDAHSKAFHLQNLEHIMGFRVAGVGPVNCHISGKLYNPRIRGDAKIDDAVLEGMPFDHVETGVVFKDLILAFKKLDAERGTSRVSTSELAFDFNAKGGLALNTKINAKSVAIEELFDLFEIDHKGWGSPTGRLDGLVAVAYNLSPERLQVNAEVKHRHLRAFGESFESDDLRLDWNDGELVIHEAKLRKGKAILLVTGAVRSDKTLSFIGVASDLQASEIDYEPLKELGLETKIQAFVVVEGTLDHPKGTVELKMGDLFHRRARYGPSALSLTIDGPVFKGKGTVAGDQITVEHLHMDFGRERFAVELFMDDIDLVPLLGLESKMADTALGVTGELALMGRLSDPPRLKGHAELMHVRAKVGDFEFQNLRKSKIKVVDSQFKIGATPFAGRDVSFNLGGLVGLETINLKIDGVADMASVSGMVDGVSKTAGKLKFELRATGEASHPALRGDATLTGGMVNIAKFPHPVTHIDGRATFSPNIIRFYDFTADSADGTLEMIGEIGLDGGRIRDYRFNLKANELALTPFEDLTFKVSTIRDGLTLTSGIRGGLPKITGDAEVKDLRYKQDIRVLELSDLSVDRLSGTRTTATKPKLIDPKGDFFAFDIRLHGDDNLEAHNNLFDVDLVVDDMEKPLRFVGTNQTYGFLGRILGKRGRVRFAGRRFDIRYAAVDFQDADRLDNPSFQVIADGTIRDWKVTMTAEGTIEKYEIRFASQPFLPKEDIAFLILTGLTQAENRQFGRAGFNLGMPFLGQLGPGGGELPVELQVYSEYSETAGTDTTRIAMGRWITEDVWVSVSSGVGQTRDVEAQVDYKINDEFSVSAGYEDEDEGSTGNVGLDLKFRLEF